MTSNLAPSFSPFRLWKLGSTDAAGASHSLNTRTATARRRLRHALRPWGPSRWIAPITVHALRSPPLLFTGILRRMTSPSQRDFVSLSTKSERPYPSHSRLHTPWSAEIATPRIYIYVRSQRIVWDSVGSHQTHVKTTTRSLRVGRAHSQPAPRSFSPRGTSPHPPVPLPQVPRTHCIGNCCLCFNPDTVAKGGPEHHQGHHVRNAIIGVFRGPESRDSAAYGRGTCGSRSLSGADSSRTVPSRQRLPFQVPKTPAPRALC
jgi:hypothetical protein